MTRELDRDGGRERDGKGEGLREVQGEVEVDKEVVGRGVPAEHAGHRLVGLTSGIIIRRWAHGGHFVFIFIEREG